MNKAPSFQLYPDKALAGTDHLSPPAFKAYWKVLWWMWLHSKNQCTMPDTDAAWKKATGISGLKTRKKVREEIMDKDFTLLQKKGEKLTSFGLKKEAKKIRDLRRKRKAAANARWDKDLQDSNCNANASVLQCSLSPTPTPSVSREREEKTRFTAHVKKLKEEHQDFKRVPSIQIINTLRSFPEDRWAEAIDTMLRHYAGATLRKPCGTLENYLNGKGGHGEQRESDVTIIEYAKTYSKMVASTNVKLSGWDSDFFQKVIDNCGKDGPARVRAEALTRR